MEGMSIEFVASALGHEEERRSRPSDARAPVATENRSLFQSWGEMSATEYEQPEYIVYGLCRGDVGMWAAVSNYGKSTGGRNLAISLACGKEYLTLADAGEPRRVLLLDYETTFARYRNDIETMAARFSSDAQTMIKENLRSYVAKARGIPYLNLSEPEHFKRVMEEANAFNPDLILVDTVTAGFSIREENSNSEVTNDVMKPMLNLASETDSAVLFIHHVGKSGSEEGSAANRNYRARGASAFEGMSQAVIELDVKKTRQGERAVILSFRKLKDEPKPDQVLRLNRETRWFEVAEGETAVDSGDEQYHRMLSAISGPMRAGEVNAATPFLSEATRKRYLTRAVREGTLVQPQRGMYQPVAV